MTAAWRIRWIPRRHPPRPPLWSAAACLLGVAMFLGGVAATLWFANVWFVVVAVGGWVIGLVALWLAARGLPHVPRFHGDGKDRGRPRGHRGGGRPEPVGFTGAEVRPGADEGKAVTVVERGGRKLAVVGTNFGLVTVDVTDPRRPIRLGATNLPWGKMFPVRVGVSGNTAVVAPGYTSFWWTTGLSTVDISDPARPRHVGTIIDNTTGFCIDGTRVYVNSYLNGAAIYDVARPENPLLVEETIFDDTNAGAGGTGLVGDVLVRSMGGGMETWRATLPPQAPAGPLTVAAP
jgi:hypothetical protein